MRLRDPADPKTAIEKPAAARIMGKRRNGSQIIVLAVVCKDRVYEEPGMEPFGVSEAVAIPIDEVNVDTNQLCPTRFNKVPRGEGYERILLALPARRARRYFSDTALRRRIQRFETRHRAAMPWLFG